MKIYKAISVLTLLVVVAGLLTGCPQKAPAAKEPIKIAILGPLSGDVATFGESNRDGALMAIEAVSYTHLTLPTKA